MQRCPGVPQYQLYWAQSLCKAGRYAEASRAAAGVEGLTQVRSGWAGWAATSHHTAAAAASFSKPAELCVH